MEILSPLSTVKSALIKIGDSLPLSDMHKTMLLVAAGALCCLAACFAAYLLVRRFIIGKPLESDSAKVTTAVSEVLVVDPKPAAPDSYKEPSSPTPSKAEKGSEEEFHKPKMPTPSEFYELVASATKPQVGKGPAKHDEKALQSILEEFGNPSIDVVAAFKRLFQQLSTLDGFSPLPKFELERLSDMLMTLEGMYGNDKFSIFSKMAPGVIFSLVRNSLLVGSTDCIQPILAAAGRKLLSDEQVRRFAEGFNLGTLKEKELHFSTKKFHSLFKLLLEAEHVAVLKSQLSDGEIKQFIKALFGSTVKLVESNDVYSCKDLYITTCQHAGVFGGEYRALALEVLQQVRAPAILGPILEYTETDTTATVFEMHPPEATDPEDTFFQQVVEQMAGYQSRIAEHVFKHESDKRKAILLAKLSADQVFQVLESVPLPVLQKRLTADADFLNGLWFYVRKTPTEIKLKAFAPLLEAPEQLRALLHSHAFEEVALLLPYCEHELQVQFVSSILVKDLEWGEGSKCLTAAKLKPMVWDKASRQQQLKFVPQAIEVDPERYALILNGQIAHPAGLKGHLAHLYAQHRNLDLQMACTALLKPEVFKLLVASYETEEYDYFPWPRFFEVLRKLPDQKMANGIFIDSALALLNGDKWDPKAVENFYAMTEEQMTLVPLAELKKAHIRLLVACLTDRLDDTMIDTVNSLDSHVEGYLFWSYLQVALPKTKAEPAKLFSPVFKPDIQYLKHFLHWVLDHNPIDKNTWKWIIMSGLLQREEIKEDTTLQALIDKAPVV